MANGGERSDPFLTPKFRVLWPFIFKPRQNKKDDGTVQAEYELQAVFEPGTDFTTINNALKEAATKKYGADKTKWPGNMRTPLRKCEERMKDGKFPDGFMAGGHFMRIWSKQRPGLVAPDIDTVTNHPRVILDETEFYGGCYARAQVVAFTYENKGNKGCSFALNNVQKLADGDPLSGRQRAEDAFEPVAGTAASGASADPFA